MLKMQKKLLMLMSSSRVHGFEYLEHAKQQIIDFLNQKNVKTVLFVPYALKDHDKYTEKVAKAIRPWGYEVEGIHKTPNPKEAVEKAEAIFIGGGNTFVLLKTLYELDLVEIIRKQVCEGGLPYIGSSAGTNVATRSINTTNDMPVVYPPTFDALGLVNFNINPHYLEPVENDSHKGETRDERLTEFLEYHQLPVLGLREGTSLLVKGDTVTLIGNRCAKLFRPNGAAVEFHPNDDLSFLL